MTTRSQTEKHAVRGNAGAWKVQALLFFLLVVCTSAWARDEFDGIQCGADIPKSLVGRLSSNERASVIEERHKSLGLKNLFGGDEDPGRVYLVSWRICGSEYELLVNTKSRIIRDVLPFPSHSKSTPMFIGACQADGKPIAGTIVAVLDNSAGLDARDDKLAKTLLKATAAWRVDESKENFAKQSTEKLACPLGGVVTSDGGP